MPGRTPTVPPTAPTAPTLVRISRASTTVPAATPSTAKVMYVRSPVGPPAVKVPTRAGSCGTSGAAGPTLVSETGRKTNSDWTGGGGTVGSGVAVGSGIGTSVGGSGV